jgi:hypothetical protein
MITSSNGNRARADVICCAMSNCGRSPVPLSPMTANFTESGRLGSAARCAAGADAPMTRSASSDATRRCGERVNVMAQANVAGDP